MFLLRRSGSASPDLDLWDCPANQNSRGKRALPRTPLDGGGLCGQARAPDVLAVRPAEVNWEGSQKPIRKQPRGHLGASIGFPLKR
jgi:hypothetical protein